MNWFTARNNANWNATQAERILNRFGFTASADGVLRIRPVGPILSYGELDMILRRVVAERVDQHVAEIVLDFGTVERIESPWTAVLARLIDFARRSPSRCRLVALHGQPAGVVSFFSGDRVIRSLLQLGAPARRLADSRRERATA